MEVEATVDGGEQTTQPQQEVGLLLRVYNVKGWVVMLRLIAIF